MTPLAISLSVFVAPIVGAIPSSEYTLLELSNLLEGDIIRLFRQIIDILRQMKKAANEPELISRIEDCISKIDRDVVSVEF